MFDQRGYSPVLGALLAVGVLIVIGGVYYFSQNSQNSQPVITFNPLPRSTPQASIARSSEIKTLVYKLPVGWKTALSADEAFSLGYDPKIWTPLTNVADGGLTLNSAETPFFMTIKPYSGGSRHDFILNDETLDSAATSTTKEVNYSYNGKSGLGLYNINYSASPTVGMLDIDSKLAILFKSDTNQEGTEQILSTLRILK